MAIPVVQRHTLLIWTMARSFMLMKKAVVIIRLAVALVFIPIKVMPMQMPISGIVVLLIDE